MKQSKASMITTIALGTASLIAGGLVIFQFSRMVPIPGMKYILMAPYLSLVFYIIQMRIESVFALFFVGSIFGAVMAIINIYMGIAIVITAALAQLSSIFFKDKHRRAAVGATVFSGYSVAIALIISKVFIKGVFLEIEDLWILISFILALAFGSVGTYIGIKLSRYIKLGNKQT